MLIVVASLKDMCVCIPKYVQQTLYSKITTVEPCESERIGEAACSNFEKFGLYKEYCD